MRHITTTILLALVMGCGTDGLRGESLLREKEGPLKLDMTMSSGDGMNQNDLDDGDMQPDLVQVMMCMPTGDQADDLPQGLMVKPFQCANELNFYKWAINACGNEQPDAFMRDGCDLAAITSSCTVVPSSLMVCSDFTCYIDCGDPMKDCYTITFTQDCKHVVCTDKSGGIVCRGDRGQMN